ncbi:MAG: hypothetical protein WCV67_12915 [Victivallaceae bacterium]
MESEKSEKSENQKPLCSTTLQSVGMRKPANAGVKSEKWKARKARKVKIKNRCAQRHSKVSESAVQNGFVVVPSVPDGDGSEYLSQSERNVLHTMCPECLLN